MKICIYGAGAIGSYLGAELALSGYQVTLIARGPHLEAMRASGLTLLKEGERKVLQVACTDDPDPLHRSRAGDHNEHRRKHE